MTKSTDGAWMAGGRAELASILLRSLDEPSPADPDIERSWLQEADRRDRRLAR